MIYHKVRLKRIKQAPSKCTALWNKTHYSIQEDDKVQVHNNVASIIPYYNQNI